MKCTKCGAEQEADVKFCTQCGAPMEHEDQTPENNGPEPTDTEPASGAEAVKSEEPASGAEAVKAEEPAAEAETVKAEEPAAEAENVKAEETAPAAVTVPEEPQPNKKFIKILAAVVAIAAVIAVAALAYVKMTTKDPKQVVIDAFENVFPEGQVYPSEELFGLKDFAETVKTADSQGGLTLKMDSCSDATVNAYAGSGLRFEAKDDKTNGRSFFNMGVIYSGMDLANLNAYYGDDTLMLAVPELSAKVFTVDLGEGLAERIKNSPTVGPLLEQNGVDVEGMAVYFTELMDEAEKAQTEGRQPFDVEALINRYKEGCKAQENFKAALTVEKAAKGTYTIDGAQVSCKGYNVTVSKDSMIEFLRQSSDFFLQDETLKADFMRQLETTVKMSELMGGTMSGTGTMSAEEMQQQSYEEAKKLVDQMIEYLDKALTDVNMTVYVDKKGRLAAVEGSTNLYVENTDVSEEGYIAVTFSCQLQGGAYLTQNALASITLEDATDTVSIDMVKQGTYDKSVLTSDLSLDLTVPGDETYNFTYTSTYDSKDGSYHLSGEVGRKWLTACEDFRYRRSGPAGKGKIRPCEH